MIQVTAIIPTRGDVDLRPIHQHLEQYPEITETLISVGDSPHTRFQVAPLAKNPVIYTQDDDCISDLRPLLDNYTPGIVIVANHEANLRMFPGEFGLLGWGALFDKDLVKVLDGWEDDMLFRRESTRVFLALNPIQHCLTTVTNLPWATAPNRLYHDPKHKQYRSDIHRRIQKFRKEQSAHA